MKGVKKSLLLTGLMCSVIIAGAQNLNTPNKRGPLGTQVNTISGNLFIPRTDFIISARGFDINISFYYNSYLFNEDAGYGNGWRFIYAMQYKADTTGARIISWGDGREDTYDSIAGGGYKAPLGFYSKLVQYQPGKYKLTELDSTTYFFDNSIHKKITRVQNSNGNFINFNYTGTLLTSLTNADGQSISFAYNAEGRLTGVTDAITTPSRTFTYTYNTEGNLMEVKDPLNGKNKYTYLLNGPMKTISDKNANVVDIIYYPDYSTRELIGCNKRISFSYDTLTQKTITTDHFDNGGVNQVTNYTYQKTENLGWITSMSGNCCGYNINYEYDDQGNEIKMTDANGQIYKYTYDDNGNMLTSTDPLNQVSSYTYSTDYNKITNYKDNKGFLYTITYDARGNMTQLIAPGNTIYTAAYNANGDIISSTDPKGNIFTYNYDGYGNPTHVTGPNGYNATLSFDARGNLLAYTDARGNGSTAEYDILDRLKKITDPINNKVQLNYDANGNIVSVLNKNNETNLFNYDASDRLVKLTGPTGNQAYLEYDAMDNLISVKNALGFETKLYYDTRNRLSAIKDPDNNSSTINYDANGNITSITEANSHTLQYIYDQLNRLIAVTDNNGTIGAITYDKNNNITSYINGTGAATTAIYDSLNRIKQLTDPLGNSSFYTYDKNNNINSVTDRNGFTNSYTYDSLDRVKTFTDNNGFVITVGYDAAGNAVSLKDQNNNTTTYTYDSLNRRKRMTYPDASFIQYAYDKKGNVISKRLTDGSIITYQYDTLNRVIARQLPGGEAYIYSYDALGRVISATNNAGTVILTYDKLNRITSETFDGRTIGYQYNIAGRTQTTVYPDGSKLIKEYDTRNRLIKILKDSAIMVGYSYNNNNQLTNKTFANGVSSNMQYDFANRLSSISTANGTIQNTLYIYDKEMNKTSIIRQNNPALSEQFTYDNGYRLTNYKRGPAGSPVIQNNYSYDAVGNRTLANLNGINTNYTINSLNQVSSTSGGQNILFTYDGRGNLTYDGVFYKTYDAEGRLLTDSSSPANVIAYSYDAFNRRVIKNINGNLLKYTYSGAAQIEERDGSNTILNKTVFTNFLSPVSSEKNGNRYYYHQNELNSVEAITNSNGRLLERYQYDVYGKPSRYDSLNNPLASSFAGNRFGFTGQEYDSASGSYRFFYRNYSPATGVFNQRDLIEYGDGMGMYQYVGDDPANGIDVFGLQDCSKSKSTKDQISAVTDPVKKTSTIVSYLYDGSKFLKDNGALQEGLDFVDGLGPVKTTLDVVTFPFDAIELSADVVDYAKTTKQRSRLENAEKAGDLLVDGIGVGAGGVTAAGAFTTAVGATLIAPEVIATAVTVGTGVAVYKGVDKGSQFVFDYYFDESSSIENGAKGHQISEGRMDDWIAAERREEEKSKRWHELHDCPPHGGSRRPAPGPNNNGQTASMEIRKSNDPNEIIGPAGQPNVHWVSVKDRLPYTILFENSADATAPAKYVRITTPIESKQNVGTFLLGDFGFNSTTFTVPANTTSYYNRLDARDSIGLYVDITAGYDQVNNVAFWEFQAIDPITLQPPPDPLKGFLLTQDSLSLLNGHGFVNFTIKPKQSAVTLDTIGARAQIIFDSNDTIPTNIYTNTIDALPPTSHITAVSSPAINTVALSWSGADDAGGSGIAYYTIYVSADMVNYSMLISKTTRTDTTLILASNPDYCFFVIATDRTGNTEVLRPADIKCVSLLGGTLPVTWLYFNGINQGTNNLLKWATGSEQNSKEFQVERSLTGSNFQKIGVVAAAGNSNSTTTYQYTDTHIDLLNSNVMFYRLKQLDLDNHSKYSSIVRLNYNRNGLSPTIVYPNPTRGFITITVSDNKLIGTEAILSDVNGRVLRKIMIANGSQSIDMNGLVNGTYFIRLSNNETLKVVKQ